MMVEETDGAWELCVRPAWHTGVNESLAAFMCSAACVCFRRHHVPPKTIIGVTIDSIEKSHTLSWQSPTQRDYNANHSRQDATRDGAYAVALVCVEQRLRLYAIGRADDRSGADWYLAPAGYVTDTEVPNLDDPTVVRLEVGGHDDRPSLPYELKKKIRQLYEGVSDKTGVAVVVGFQKAQILVATGVAAGRQGGVSK